MEYKMFMFKFIIMENIVNLNKIDQSPCSSNPCSPIERCIEESSTLYSCQCIDEPCNFNEILSENTLNCININSPTCRGMRITVDSKGRSCPSLMDLFCYLIHLSILFRFIEYINIRWL